MMARDRIQRVRQEADALQHPPTNLRMTAHEDPLLGIERGAFAQDGVWHRDLADVVQDCAKLQLAQGAVGQPTPPGNAQAVLADPLDVSAGVVVARLHRLRQRRDRLQIPAIEPVG